MKTKILTKHFMNALRESNFGDNMNSLIHESIIPGIEELQKQIEESEARLNWLVTEEYDMEQKTPILHKIWSYLHDSRGKFVAFTHSQNDLDGPVLSKTEFWGNTPEEAIDKALYGTEEE